MMQARCLHRSFYICDLRSGQFRDLPIISVMGEKSSIAKTHQIGSYRSGSWYIRLLLMTSVQICISDPLEGHPRSDDDVMGSIRFLADNF